MSPARAVLIALLLGALAPGALTSSAGAADGFAERIFDDQRAKDLSEDVRGALNQALDASCAANDALKAAVAHNADRFNELLAETRLRLQTVADKLSRLGNQRSFKNFVSISGPENWVVAGEVVQIRDGDQMLAAIVRLALHAHEAIERIESGKGDEADLNLVAVDAAKISELVFAFYTARRV
jgi:hypothetical protein